MKDLKCAMRQCKFNNSFCCCADEICVSGGANCSSYAISESKRNDVLFEVGGDSVRPDFSVDTYVNCSAPCVFQKENKCVAVGITVLTNERKAECATFTKK